MREIVFASKAGIGPATFLTPLFQGVGFALQSACCVCADFPGNELRVGEWDGQLLANIAVPIYQTGCLLYFPLDGLGTVLFLVDTLLLTSNVRFRFVYLWITFVILAIDIDAFFISVREERTESISFFDGAVYSARVAVALLIGGVLLTLLTRVVSKCCPTRR